MRTEIHIQSQIKEVTKRLHRMHKSDYPLAVRGAINAVAKDMKENTLQNSFNKNFNISRKTFLKSHSGYTLSPNTFDINKMVSYCGIMRGKMDISSYSSGERLDLQERGGQMQDRAIPFTRNGIGEAYRGKNEKSTIHSAYFYRHFKKKPNGVIFKNKGITLVKTDKAILLNKKGVKNGKYAPILYLLHRNPKIKANPFRLPAENISHAKIDEFFFKEAQKRFDKVLNK